MPTQSVLTKTKYQQKLEELEKEILKLKKGAGFKFPPKIISLKGILKGIKITEEDIEKAKKSLFKEAKI
ncbi:hypothetical protein KJ636_02660 [Patescibacteria group bacterium]|nr:hypothetical protein [Patescibacteria group bacterium]MBU4481218.1 hypothetical protein [Patescibacteria group bacterium]